MRYAITGSIGTGKTTVSNILRDHGIVVFDADKMVHQLYEDREVLEEVKKIISEAFLEGKMDKKKVADIIFNDINKKTELENYIHPLVREKIKELDNCFVEVPLLFESKMEDLFSKIILVYAKKKVQIKRIMERDNLTKEKAIIRINSQMDIEEKKKKSDYIVYNNGKQKRLVKQVLNIVDDITGKM